MKKLILIVFLIGNLTIVAQDKLMTKNGSITFEASVPSFEEVKAKNTTSSCILHTKNGEIASLALIKGFKFKIALMEEHFNENYIESTKFPKATFKGKIENFDYSKVTTIAQNYTIKGTIELHGKTKELSIIGKIKKTNEGLELKSNFSLNSDDFNIEIPNVVSKKVSKKILISLDFLLK